MTDEFKLDKEAMDMTRMLNIEEVKVITHLWKMLDVKGVPIDDIPEDLIHMDAVKYLMNQLCNAGKKYNLSRAEMVIAVRCALFDVLWNYTLVDTEVAKQKFQHDNKQI